MSLALGRPRMFLEKWQLLDSFVWILTEILFLWLLNASRLYFSLSGFRVGRGARAHSDCDRCSPLYHGQTRGGVIRDVCCWKQSVDFGIRTQMVLIADSDNNSILFCLFFTSCFRPSVIKLTLLFPKRFQHRLPLYDWHFPKHLFSICAKWPFKIQLPVYLISPAPTLVTLHPKSAVAMC